MKNQLYIQNAPNIYKLARDSRPGTVPVSLKIKNKTYAILKASADSNDTSVGSIINELLDNYLQSDKTASRSLSEDEIADIIIKEKLQKIAGRLKKFNDIELSAYIYEQGEKELIDNCPFDSPRDVDRYIADSIDFPDLYLNTVSAPIVCIGDEATFEENLDSIDDEVVPFPIYIFTIPRGYFKIVASLLFVYVDLYNQYKNKDYADRIPCIIENQFKKLTALLNQNPEKEALIDGIVEVLTNV